MAPVTRFGLQLPLFNFPGVEDPADLLDVLGGIAATAEGNGFDSIWPMDHLHQIAPVGPPDLWMLEGNTLAMALACRTSTARVGLMVGGVPYRNPAFHAKVTTTIDVLSGGRAIHGIGAAWFEGEARAYGYDWPSMGERFEHLEDHLRIARAMFTQPQSTVEGKHHSTRDAYNIPQPVHGDIPIMLGGSGERKTLRMVAQYADASNIFGDLEGVRHKLGVLARHCETFDRDPATITTTRLNTLFLAPTHEEAVAKRDARMPDPATHGFVLCGDPDGVAEQVRALLDAGLDGLIVSMPDVDDLDLLAQAGQTLRAAL